MDLTFLGAMMNEEESDPKRVKIAMAAVAGVTLLDILASIEHTRDHIDPSWYVHREDRSGWRRDPQNISEAPDVLAIENAPEGGIAANALLQ
jgi:hypothetical protein